jgi:hypothetical protein
MDHDGRLVSTKELKERARALPEGSPTRAAIASLPGDIPQGEAGPLAKTLSRMLSRELPGG